MGNTSERSFPPHWRKLVHDPSLIHLHFKIYADLLSGNYPEIQIKNRSSQNTYFKFQSIKDTFKQIGF